MLVKGRTAMEGLSGRERAGFGCFAGVSLTASPAGLFASRTVPTKRKPLRGSVLIRRCFSPESPIALRAALRRVVSATSDTMRPFQMAFTRSSLLTTCSLLRTEVSTREASDPPDEHPISGNAGWPEVDTVRRTAEADWVKRRRRRTSRNLWRPRDL